METVIKNIFSLEENKMAKKVVLAGACRTAIGTMGGTLSTTPAAELGAIVIKEALNRMWRVRLLSKQVFPSRCLPSP